MGGRGRGWALVGGGRVLTVADGRHVDVNQPQTHLKQLSKVVRLHFILKDKPTGHVVVEGVMATESFITVEETWSTEVTLQIHVGILGNDLFAVELVHQPHIEDIFL